MVTNEDEGKGLVKTWWGDIRHRVAKVDPNFAKIVDNLSPDKTFPIYLAYYPYGDIICDTEHHYLPKIEGGTYNLLDPAAPKEVVKHLGYGLNGIPFGMVLDKVMEYFVDFRRESLSIPWYLYSPGRVFPFTKILTPKDKHFYSTNNILMITSGVRSTFMLADIGCLTNHANLQREYNLQLLPPKSLYAHWEIFKQLSNSNIINSDWRSCLIYFPEKWVEKLHGDKAWLELKTYLYELAWGYTKYNRNSIYYDTAFSIIQKKRNLKPNPYLTDSSKHFFSTTLGAAPGYIPATDDSALPLNLLQKIFVKSYGLKKYIPTIMQPTLFDFEKDTLPFYYSLQYPSTNNFSPKARKTVNTLFELRELEHITKVFKEELSKATAPCSDTVINTIAKIIEFRYFHNEFDRHHIIKASSEMPNFDPRFNAATTNSSSPDARFCSDARFLRGCVSINIKKSSESKEKST